MTRQLRAQRWHYSETEIEDRPAIPSLEREPWRVLQSSIRIRFIGARGSELDVNEVHPNSRAELVSALEARHLLGSVFTKLKHENFKDVTARQRLTLDLLVFGFIDVRHLKSGDFRLDFRSSGRKGRFTVPELSAAISELQRLV